MHLIALQLYTTDNFNTNLENLLMHIKNSPSNSIILAPELCLSGYAYNKFEEAFAITVQATRLLKEHSVNKMIALSMIVIENDAVYNRFFTFYNQQILHTQDKAQLFVLNDEKKYFKAGTTNAIKIFEVNGLKIGVLICFELRFIDLWLQLQGADVILIPAMWGKLRKDHFETLCKALAIANQCFVIASDSANEDMAKSSAVISPFGVVESDDNLERIALKANFSEIKKMRRYMNVGIS